jgi:hypothetical protein
MQEDSTVDGGTGESLGEEAIMMAGHGVNVSYTGISGMLGSALIMLWLWLRGGNLRDLGEQAMLSVTGYLRPRPDAAMECALRTAFTELDRELAEVLSDRPVPHP